ncbi:MAG: porin family protein [Chitinophagales bacterium]
MKTLIQFFCIFCISFLCCHKATLAQTFEIKGGANFMNVSEKNDVTIGTYKTNIGFHLGADVDIPINTYLSIEPSVLLTTKGLLFVTAYPAISKRTSTKIYYLEFPLLLKANRAVGEYKETKLSVMAGPYIGFGVNGRTCIAKQAKTVEKSSFGLGKGTDYKQLDTGLTFGAGIQLKMTTLEVSYDVGLVNIYNDQIITLKNRVLKFSVGYSFGRPNNDYYYDDK